MYVDFNYYGTEYRGAVIESENDFKAFERRAERLVDAVTLDKLTFAFPDEEEQPKAVYTVKDCICELADFLYQVDRYTKDIMANTGVVETDEGYVRGKIAKSVTSGTESISFSETGDAKTMVMEAAKDKKICDVACYSMIRSNLKGVCDRNGVNLLYSGPYPGRRNVWE